MLKRYVFIFILKLCQPFLVGYLHSVIFCLAEIQIIVAFFMLLVQSKNILQLMDDWLGPQHVFMSAPGSNQCNSNIYMLAILVLSQVLPVLIVSLEKLGSNADIAKW